MVSYWSAKKSFKLLMGANCLGNFRAGYTTWMCRGNTRVQGGVFVDPISLNSPSFRRYTLDVLNDERLDLIRLLRERTSAPIRYCKTSLAGCEWDIDAAEKDLRKRGIVSLKSRIASQGLLAMAESDNRSVVIELNCETDFVARNDIFQHLALALARNALSSACPVENVQETFKFGPEYLQNMNIDLNHPKLSGETTVQSAITEVAAMVGENVKLRRGFVIPTISNGVICSYLHSCPQPGLGLIAGILTLKAEVSEVSTALSLALREVGSSLAMHIVAAKPLFLSREHVSSEVIENERDIIKSQALNSGKTKIAMEKMMEGRMEKYFQDVVLLEQKYVMNNDINIKTVLDDLSKEVGSSVKISNFMRMQAGEGIPKE